MSAITGIFSSTLTQLSLPGTEAQVRINQQRALFVRLTDDTGAYVAPGGGTTDEAAWTAGASSFSPTGGAFNDSAQALTSGQQGTARATANRALHVNVRDHLGNEATLTGNSLNVNVTNGAAGGTSQADKSAFTVGTTNINPIGGLARTGTPDTVADATAVAAALTLQRGLHVNLRANAGTELIGQLAMAASIPVAIASNQSAIPVSQSGSWSLAANQSVNVAQVNGVTVSTGTGVMGTGVQRVAIASDNDPVTVKQGTAANLLCTASQGGTWTVQPGATANAIANSWRVQVTDLTNTMPTMDAAARKGFVQITDGTNSVTVKAASTAALATDTSLVVSLNPNTIPAVSQSGTWNIGTVTTVTTVSTVTALTTLTGGGVADAAADSGNPVKIGGRYLSAPGTALATGNRGDLFIDDQHALIVAEAPHAWVTTQNTTIASSSAETTIVTAGAAGIFLDLQTLILTNATATACTATIKDATAGTTRMIIDLAANGGAVINLPVRHPQAAAASNWTCTLSVATVTVHIYALCVQRK